jgi:hypothetical protein
MSQVRLARKAGVSRFKICMYEVGDGALSADEQNRVREALRAEADRLVESPSRSSLASLSRPQYLRRSGDFASCDAIRGDSGYRARDAPNRNS